MNKMLFLFAPLLLISCGKFEEKFGRLSGDTTTVHLQAGNASPLAALELYGRIGVYLVGENGNPFSTNVFLRDRFETVSLQVPNGSYRIYAVGWDGDNSGACSNPVNCSPMQSQTRCTPLSGHLVTLSGGSATVPLVLDDDSCSPTLNSVFSEGASALTSLKPLHVKLCTSASSMPSCTGPSSTNYDVKMEAVGYVRTGGNMQVLENNTFQIGCATAMFSTPGAQTAKNFPTGSPSAAHKPFAYRFKVYSSNNATCTGTLLGEYLFPVGLANFAQSPGASTTNFTYDNSAGSHAAVYLKGPF